MIAQDGRRAGSIRLLASDLSVVVVHRPHDYPNSLIAKRIDVPCCRHVERSILRDAEPDHSWMDEPCQSALPDQPLETIIGLPVTLACSMKKLQVQGQAVMRVANNKVKAVKTVQPNGCPSFAVLPTIWTPMWLTACDQPRTLRAVRHARRRLFPGMGVHVKTWKALLQIGYERKHKAPLQVGLLGEAARKRISEQAAHQAGLKSLDCYHHSCLANDSGSPAAPRVCSAGGERHRRRHGARNNLAVRVAHERNRVHRGLNLNNARAAPPGAAGCYTARRIEHHTGGCPRWPARPRPPELRRAPRRFEARSDLVREARILAAARSEGPSSVAAPEIETPEPIPPPTINSVARRSRVPRRARRPHDVPREERMSLRFSRPYNACD